VLPGGQGTRMLVPWRRVCTECSMVEQRIGLRKEGSVLMVSSR